MLLLSCKTGYSVFLYDDNFFAKVFVKEVEKKNSVKIGYETNNNVKIFREKVLYNSILNGTKTGRRELDCLQLDGLSDTEKRLKVADAIESLIKR